MRFFILGCGHMGSFLAREIAKEGEVLAWDPDPAKQAPVGARRAATLDEMRDFAPDMLVNCASLENTAAAFNAAIPFLPAACLLADIASVKGDIPAYYARSGRRFVSTHPMFGPTNADLNSPGGENAILISESDQVGKEFFRGLYRRLGVKTYDYSFDEHDRTVAYSLSTPFASTLVFAACMKKQDAPGTNFKKHLAIAKGLLAEDDFLLSEIMFNPYTLEQIERINQKLSYLTHVIKARDYEEMSLFLARLRANIAD